MHIDRSECGNITVDGKTYDHDVTIRPVGSHQEAAQKTVQGSIWNFAHHLGGRGQKRFRKGSELLIIGAGQEGNVRLSPEAEKYLAKAGCEVLLQPTQETIKTFNRRHEHKIALIHVTC